MCISSDSLTEIPIITSTKEATIVSPVIPSKNHALLTLQNKIANRL
ncbi:MAG: hypothetical protein ACFFDT_40240 [Candidatus Hodarchaeota archaeon]